MSRTLRLLLINSYMNWLAIVLNHYRIVHFKDIMMVHFSNIINIIESFGWIGNIDMLVSV